MTVTRLKCDLDGLSDLIGLGLPGAEADTGHLVASVQGEHGPKSIVRGAASST